MKVVSLILAVALGAAATLASAYTTTEAVQQPADMTAYVKCQLDNPEFDNAWGYDASKGLDTPCMKLSSSITKDHFGGDFAKFHQWWLDNAMAATMEVLPTWPN